MSKSSQKQLAEQLMQWLPTLSSKRKKHVKVDGIRQRQPQRR